MGYDAQETAQVPVGAQFSDVQSDEIQPAAGITAADGEPERQPQSKGKGKARATGNGKRKATAAMDQATSPDRPAKKPRSSRKKKAAEDDEDEADEPPAAKPALAGQVAPSGWKKMDGLRGPEPPRKPSGDYYDSYQEVLDTMSPPGWMPPIDDEVPQNVDELRPYMRLLRDAMIDLSEFKDKLSNNSFKKRWLDEDYATTGRYGRSVTNPYYPGHVLEGLAWRIAVSNLKLEQQRTHADKLTDYDPTAPHSWTPGHQEPGATDSRAIV